MLWRATPPPSEGSSLGGLSAAADKERTGRVYPPHVPALGPLEHTDLELDAGAVRARCRDQRAQQCLEKDAITGRTREAELDLVARDGDDRQPLESARGTAF